MKHKYFAQHHYFKMTFNNMLLRLFHLTSFLFNTIIEISGGARVFAARGKRLCCRPL